MPALVLVVLAFLLCGRAHAADYQLLQQLPDRLHAAAVKSVEQPCRMDPSAPTADSIARQKQYDDALVRMMHDIVKAFPAVTTAEAVDKFVKATYEVYRFQRGFAKPSDRGDRTWRRNDFFLGAAAADFERTLEAMVVRATEGDKSFDYQSWKKRWEAAKNPCRN